MDFYIKLAQFASQKMILFCFFPTANMAKSPWGQRYLDGISFSYTTPGNKDAAVKI